MSNLRVTWWLNPRPSLTMEWLTDDHLETLIRTAGNVLSYLDEPEKAAPAVVHGWFARKLAVCVYGSLACQEYRVNRCMGNSHFWEFANRGRELVREGAAFQMPEWYQDEHLMQSHWSTGLREKALVADLKVPWRQVDEFWPTLWPVATEDGGYELRINKADKAALEIDDLWLPDDVRSRVVNL